MHEIAFLHQQGTRATGNWRANSGIVEIEFGGRHHGFVGHDACRGRRRIGALLVRLLLGHVVLCRERRVALGLATRVVGIRLVTRKVGLRLHVRGTVRTRVDFEQYLAGDHVAALTEAHLPNDALHLRRYGGGPHRHHDAIRVDVIRHVGKPSLDDHHRHRRFRAYFGFLGTRRQQQEQRERAKRARTRRSERAHG